MARVTAYGPVGALLSLHTLNLTLHGVRVRTVASGKPDYHGAPGTMTVFYVDDKRSTREKANARLAEHIAPGERVTLEGSMIL